MRLLGLAFVMGFVAWGAARPPGKAFSWTMYAGSSKPFLWTDSATTPRVPTYGELRLAPDSHYLTLPDLERLVREAERAVPVQGLIMGSRGSWRVDCDGDERRLVSTPLTPGEDLAYLVSTLQRFGCRPP